MKHFAGLDVGLEETAVCIVDGSVVDFSALAEEALSAGLSLVEGRTTQAPRLHPPATIEGEATVVETGGEADGRVTRTTFGPRVRELNLVDVEIGQDGHLRASLV